MGYRYLGQETQVSLTVNGKLATTLRAIKSTNLILKGAAVPSDYLGEPGPDYDEVSDGVDIKLDFEPDDDGFWDLLGSLVRRKQGLEHFVVNINTRLMNRGGQRRLIVVPNVSFGDLPIEIPERKQKVRGSLSGNAKVVLWPKNL